MKPPRRLRPPPAAWPAPGHTPSPIAENTGTPSVFRCGNCGNEQPSAGPCPGCGAGECLAVKPKGKTRDAVHVSQVAAHDDAERLSTGIDGLDRVLGGGLVDDGVVLVYGGEGSGKSTLLAELARNLSEDGLRVYAWSGEENTGQLKARAVRVGLDSQVSERDCPLWLRHTSSLEEVESDVKELDPDVILGDSIQTIATMHATGHAGTVEQIGACARWFVGQAKERARCVILTSQLNAEGDTSGGRYLRHLVDVVLELGEDGAGGRFCTAPKNRYGATGEACWLEMTAEGFLEAPDAAREVLERTTPGAGVVFLPDASSERATWVRVEAVVSDEAGEPMLRGVDPARVRPLLRVLRSQAGLDLTGRSLAVEVGTVLGAPCRDPGLELAIAAAVLSADARRPWPHRTAAWGRVSVRGAVEPVARDHARITAARGVEAHVLCSMGSKLRETGPLVRRVRHVGELTLLLAGGGAEGVAR